VIVQLEFAGVFKKPPSGCRVSPTLTTGAVGLVAGKKLIAGMDVSGAWSGLRFGSTVNVNKAKSFEPVEEVDTMKF
jgi:hypothetical protein